jgi:hypothetical protein
MKSPIISFAGPGRRGLLMTESIADGFGLVNQHDRDIVFDFV